jgi:hypothetical protein
MPIEGRLTTLSRRSHYSARDGRVVPDVTCAKPCVARSAHHSKRGFPVSLRERSVGRVHLRLRGSALPCQVANHGNCHYEHDAANTALDHQSELRYVAALSKHVRAFESGLTPPNSSFGRKPSIVGACLRPNSDGRVSPKQPFIASGPLATAAGTTEACEERAQVALQAPRKEYDRAAGRKRLTRSCQPVASVSGRGPRPRASPGAATPSPPSGVDRLAGCNGAGQSTPTSESPLSCSCKGICDPHPSCRRGRGPCSCTCLDRTR